MNVDKISPFLPKKGFFRLYHEFTRNGEICPRYNFFTALSILGAVLKRKIYLQRGSSTTFPTLYPNPWILLVGPQGRGKKSSALRIGRKLLSKVNEVARPNILASKITPEALIKALASHAVSPEMAAMVPNTPAKNILKKPAIAYISSSELGVFLSKAKYNTGLIDLLTELYDCHDEWHSDTVMRGDMRLYDLALTIGGGTTPAWMQTMLPQEAFKTGFMSRWLLVPLPYHWRKRVSNPPAPPDFIEKAIIELLEQFSNLRGRVDLSPGAWIAFDKWYMNLDSSLLPDVVAAYTERQQDHLLKLAMIMQVTYTPDRLVIMEDTLQQALNILTAIEEEVKDLVEYIATEPRMRSVQKTLEVIRAHGFISEWKLVKEVWRTLNRPHEFNEAVALLVQAKEITGPEMLDGSYYYRYKKEDKDGK